MSIMLSAQPPYPAMRQRQVAPTCYVARVCFLLSHAKQCAVKTGSQGITQLHHAAPAAIPLPLPRRFLDLYNCRDSMEPALTLLDPPHLYRALLNSSHHILHLQSLPSCANAVRATSCGAAKLSIDVARRAGGPCAVGRRASRVGPDDRGPGMSYRGGALWRAPGR